jgi:hypothetical protein
MPIDPKAMLNLWSLAEIPACDEGMELARSFLVSAGEAVSRVQNEDPEHLHFSRNFVRVLCATVRDFSAVTMQLNPGKELKTNKRGFRELSAA